MTATMFPQGIQSSTVRVSTLYNPAMTRVNACVPFSLLPRNCSSGTRVSKCRFLVYLIDAFLCNLNLAVDSLNVFLQQPQQGILLHNLRVDLDTHFAHTSYHGG